MNGNIFDIQRFCTSDGPGIRTTVFFKGCPLRCEWCHNPESQLKRNELLYDVEKCVNCLRCVSACSKGAHISKDDRHVFLRDRCVACGACVSPTCEALEIKGADITVEEILAEVMKDKPYYDNSDGGLTLSGGEPLWQSDFCLEIMAAAKALGLHICVETCGYLPLDMIEKSAELVDIYLFDIKETDRDRHKAYTGVDNEKILENLRFLDSIGKRIYLRCPIIRGVNDRNEHFRAIAELAGSLENVLEITVEPYHSLGENKYKRLGREYSLEGTKQFSDDEVTAIIEKIQAHTRIPVKKG